MSRNAPRIYDAFQFDSELDLLEHRLKETFDLVDRFVLVEAAQTFRGEPKMLAYAANSDRFAWAAKKIKHVALSRLPGASAWEREAFQRNAILLGLLDAQSDDIVLILDADEIVSRSFLQQIRAEGLERPYRLAMTRHYEYLDQLGPRSPCCPLPSAAFAFEPDRILPGTWTSLDPCWSGHSAVAVRWRDLAGDPERLLPARSSYEFRRRMPFAPVRENCGRHFSAVDRSAGLEKKLARFSHAELGDTRARFAPFLSLARRHGIHHHGWWYAEQPAGALPDDLERLSRFSPSLRRRAPMPGVFRRQLVRNWAWLRFWPALPDRLVIFIDRHFAILLPLLGPVLLAAGGLRRIGARLGWRWLRALSAEADHLGHG